MSAKGVESLKRKRSKIIRVFDKMDRLLKLGIISSIIALVFAVILQFTGNWFFVPLVVAFGVAGAGAIGIIVSVYIEVILRRYLEGGDVFPLALGKSVFEKLREWMIPIGIIMLGGGVWAWACESWGIAVTAFLLGTIYLGFAGITYLVDWLGREGE
jgi:hypothetical protein